MVASSVLTGAQSRLVASARELTKVISTAKPGDTIFIADGTYDSWVVSLDSHGREGQPISILPLNTDGVTFTGRTHFLFSGRHIYFKGFLFDHCDHEDSPIELAQSKNCRIETCSFQNGGGRKAVITIESGSQENTIEGCRFINITGRSINLRITESYKKLGIPFGNIIRNNHFQDIPPIGGNGRETIKIGQDQPTYGHVKVGTLVEGNTFLRCNGEAEIISNKCSENIYRRNTFTDCNGEIVMRGGAYCRIEANRLVNCRGGIRLSGAHHQVSDNVIIDSRGTGIRLLFGMTKEQGGHYQAAGNCMIENNTIINAAGPGILIGDGKDKDWNEKGIQNVAPTGNHFRNNLIIGQSLETFIVTHTPDNLLEGNSFQKIPD